MNNVQRKIKAIRLVRDLSISLKIGTFPIVSLKGFTYRITGVKKCNYKETQANKGPCSVCAGFILLATGYEICATHEGGEIDVLEEI